MSTPSSTIHLLSNVPLDSRYEHTFDFPSRSIQATYFLAKSILTLNDYQYLRKNNSIRVQRHYDQMSAANYLMYKNELGNWVYCFIIDTVYINDNVTEILLIEDVLQTYMFDYTFRQCFVEREHCQRWLKDASNNITPNYSLTDEQLDYGNDYEQYLKKEMPFTDGVVWFLMVCTQDVYHSSELRTYTMQGSPTPFNYFLLPYSLTHPTAPFIAGTPITATLPDDYIVGARTLYKTAQQSANPFILSISFLGHLNQEPLVYWDETYHYDGGTGAYFVQGMSGDISGQVVINECPNLGNYKYMHFRDYNDSNRTLSTITGCSSSDNIPTSSDFNVGVSRNYNYESKLLTYPYKFNLLTNWRSEPLVVKNEYLSNLDSIVVKMCLGLFHEPKTKYWIDNYNGDDGHFYTTIDTTVNDLPLSTDAYQNYMLANKNQYVTGLGINNTSIAGQLLFAKVSGSGDVTGDVTGAVDTMINTMGKVLRENAKRQDLQNIPDSIRKAGNNISFDIAADNLSCKFVRYQIKPEFKQRIADFFALYGYRVGRMKVPDTSSRYYYNYVKTISASISGNIDNRDMNTIKEIFNKGITIWHVSRPNVTPLVYDYDNVEVNLLPSS